MVSAVSDVSISLQIAFLILLNQSDCAMLCPRKKGRPKSLNSASALVT